MKNNYQQIVERKATNYKMLQELKDQKAAKCSKYFGSKRIFNSDESKSFHDDISKIDSKINYLEFENKVLSNNAKIALYEEVVQPVCNILNKYSGKQYGEKTKEKIKNEFKELTNCYMYIHPDICNYIVTVYTESRQQINISLKNSQENKFLVNNKIQKIDFENLYLDEYKCVYVEDIQGLYNKLLEVKKEIFEKQQELEKLKDEYNSLVVGNLQSLYGSKKIDSLEIC